MYLINNSPVYDWTITNNQFKILRNIAIVENELLKYYYEVRKSF